MVSLVLRPAECHGQELVEFPDGTLGIALNLDEDTVGAIIMGEYSGIQEGDLVRSTGRISSVPVGDAMIGRVINAVGQPIDGKGPIETDKFRPVERIAPNVVSAQERGYAGADWNQGHRRHDPDWSRTA